MQYTISKKSKSSERRMDEELRKAFDSPVDKSPVDKSSKYDFPIVPNTKPVIFPLVPTEQPIIRTKRTNPIRKKPIRIEPNYHNQSLQQRRPRYVKNTKPRSVRKNVSSAIGKIKSKIQSTLKYRKGKGTKRRRKTKRGKKKPRKKTHKRKRK